MYVGVCMYFRAPSLSAAALALSQMSLSRSSIPREPDLACCVCTDPGGRGGGSVPKLWCWLIDSIMYRDVCWLLIQVVGRWAGACAGQQLKLRGETKGGTQRRK